MATDSIDSIKKQKSDCVLPDYDGGSIVNLMSSIAKGLGGSTGYKELRILPGKELKKKKNIVLIIFDGLGYEYIKDKRSVFTENMAGHMTSVVPSTTATAITSFMTGEAPAQHGFTGWYVFLKEIGMMCAVLPYLPRMGGVSPQKLGADMRGIVWAKPFTSKISARSFVIQGSAVFESAYSKIAAGTAKRMGYDDIDGFFRCIKRAITSSSKRKFIYAYWPTFDSICHHNGVKSRKAKNHSNELDKKMRRFQKSISKTDTIVIATADHGLIDTTIKKTIVLNDHKEIYDCLIMPLSGDARLAYCYVKPDRMKTFESLFKKQLSRYFWLFKSRDIVKRGLFGPIQPDRRFYDRIGDYTIIAKKDYVMRDYLLDNELRLHIGNHAGLSKDEMKVPLIVFRLGNKGKEKKIKKTRR